MIFTLYVQLTFTKQKYSKEVGKKSAAISFVINEELWKIKDLEEYLKMEIKEMPANIDELI